MFVFKVLGMISGICHCCVIAHRAADDLDNVVYVCGYSYTPTTNTLGTCVASMLPGFTGTLKPSGVAVSKGVAWVGNQDDQDASCGLIRCIDPALMDGCSCALTGAHNARNVRGVTVSPAGDRLYFTSEMTGGVYGIVACNLTGTAISACTSHLSDTDLVGIFATDSVVYVAASVTVSGSLYSRTWVCDAAEPDPATRCVKTGQLFPTGSVDHGHWGISVLNGTLYVPDDTTVDRCLDANNATNCASLDLLKVNPKVRGVEAVAVVPRP